MRIRAAVSAWNQSTWNRRGKVSGAAVAAAALVAAALPLWTAPASSAAAVAPAVTLAGSIGTMPAASATVVVEANMPLDRNSVGVPQRIEEVPVASATLTSPEFSIPVPNSATLAEAMQQGHGMVNFTLVVASGSSVTVEGIPAPIDLPSSAATAAQLRTQKAGTVHVPAFPAFRPMTPAQAAAMGAMSVPKPGTYFCLWTAYGSQYDDMTRVGEVHVANTSGLSDRFVFANQNDQTITFGFTDSSGADGGWSGGGTTSLTNSLSASGGHTFGSGAVDYADSTYFYQRYQANDLAECIYEYEILAVGTDSNVGPGTHTPPVNPYGGCQNDPYNFPFYASSTWERDLGSAEYYSGIATVYGFTFGGSDGFTTNVTHDYTSAPGSATTYICGSPGYQADDSPILYNTTG